jgi:hypothetical protein
LCAEFLRIMLFAAMDLMDNIAARKTRGPLLVSALTTALIRHTDVHEQQLCAIAKSQMRAMLLLDSATGHLAPVQRNLLSDDHASPSAAMIAANLDRPPLSRNYDHPL